MRLTHEEIEDARTSRGGWTRATLESWGVPWPPPKGWRMALIRGNPIPHQPHPAPPSKRRPNPDQLPLL